MDILVYAEVRLFGEALASCVGDRARLCKVRCVYSYESIHHALQEVCPNALLFDVTGPNGLNRGQRLALRCTKTRVLALGLPNDPDAVIACADAGFAGFIPHDLELSMLIDEIQLALNGECRFSGKVANRFFREVSQRRNNVAKSTLSLDALTAREKETVALLCDGFCNKEIARKLNTAVSTVKNHLHNAYGKLGVDGRAQLLASLRNSPL